MARDTGLPRLDAENDFMRVRRRQVLAALAARLRGDDDSTTALSFDEVIDALGVQGERSLGIRVIPIDAIVGSVDRAREFDHRFRPTSGRSRQRWERIAYLNRTGGSLPPIDVYKLGDRYFVRDGHHRVSVARAMGAGTIEAHVTEVQTMLSPDGFSVRSDLDLQRWRRLFIQRVPLTRPEAAEIILDDPLEYGRLAEMVEAWATRTMHAEKQYMDSRTMARRWLAEEFMPVIKMIEEAELRLSEETAAAAFMRISGERYRLIRTHEWNEDVVAMIRRGRRRR